MKKLTIAILLLLPIMVIAGFLIAGSFLTAPAQAAVGKCPTDLSCEDISFPSGSGATIKGWFLNGEKGKGAVVLMHGLRANRLALIERMRFLNRAGYSVLAFDFQASGESEGKQLTFGYLESRDTTASIRFLRQRLPGEKVGVIGISMGGAAFLLQTEPEKVDAVILEMVYPTIKQAIEDRLNLWLFQGADKLSPLLTLQFPLRLGISVDEMRPIDKIGSIPAPKLLIAGENDTRTTLAESRQLFAAASDPKEMWIVPGSNHIDLYAATPNEYERKVLAFFDAGLR